MLNFNNLLHNHSGSIAVALISGYAMTKGFAISDASASIFILVGGLSMALAGVLTLFAMLRLSVTYNQMIGGAVILMSAILSFMVGYYEYEAFLKNYFIYLVQLSMILICVWSKSFDLRSFLIITIGFYALSTVVMLQSGASLTQGINSGNLVTTSASAINNYQALAQIFGMNATIFSVIALSRGRGIWFRVGFIGLGALFMGMTFFSGGRGELLASLFVIFLVVLRAPILVRIGLVLLAVYIVATTDILHTLENSSGYTRLLFALQHGDTGLRQELFSATLDQYASGNILQILFGQGVNAFQTFQKVAFGLYPHNLLLEILLTSGLFVFLFFLIMHLNIFVGGFSKLFSRNIWITLFYCMAFNVIFISMKSGNIIGAMPVFAYLFIGWYRPDLRASIFKLNHEGSPSVGTPGLSEPAMDRPDPTY